jgi:hypothetical protein
MAESYPLSGAISYLSTQKPLSLVGYWLSHVSITARLGEGGMGKVGRVSVGGDQSLYCQWPPRGASRPFQL